MKYLLDTNIVIAACLAHDARLRLRIGECDEGDLVTSAIVYAEVIFGSARGKAPLLGTLQAFVRKVPMLDFDAAAADACASLPFRRAKFDRLIAAHALSRGLVVVTTNVDDFDDIPDLCVEDWTR